MLTGFTVLLAEFEVLGKIFIVNMHSLEYTIHQNVQQFLNEKTITSGLTISKGFVVMIIEITFLKLTTTFCTPGTGEKSYFSRTYTRVRGHSLQHTT